MEIKKIIDEITKKILKSEEKIEKIFKFDKVDEIFEVYKSFNNSLSKEDFITYISESADIIKFFKNQTKEVKENRLSKVSGGKFRFE